ncbi:MAG: hypothetical protein F2520_03935 [Actinobacteria bacterium]|uniref:Unannotated protein n=1 Tax=freshwater metagenome TaxID=449393 RepID=A0A6J5YH48_9ZZZZ|nr:hypothetical protein [Actinomycetota bacterium]
MQPNDGVAPLNQERRPPTAKDFPASGPFSLAAAGARFASRAVDLSVIGLPVLTYLAFITTVVDGTVRCEVPLWLGPATFAFGALYEALFVSTLGRTPGKWLFGLRVVRLIDGGRPDPDRALLRGMVPWSFVALPLGAFAVPATLGTFGWVSGELHLSIADRAAGTVVISTR